MTKAPTPSTANGAFENDDQHRHSIRVAQEGGTSSSGEIAVITTKDEPRADTRLMAMHLGNQHRNVVQLIDRYADRFKEISHLRFQTAVGERKQGGGNAERFALLTEDQCYFLLSLSRNNERTVELKLRLVQAFSRARRAIELRHAEYLPTYHALHDEIHLIAAGSANERFVHMNVNKLMNRFAGIESGQRKSAGFPVQALLTVAQMTAASAMHGAPDHHDAYQRAKSSMAALNAAVMIEGDHGTAQIGRTA